MNSKKNVLVTIGIIMFVMLLFLIINITVNLRNFGFQSADTKAQLIAQSVKNGLTAHMVNGIMDKRDFFIDQTKKLANIDDIWIIRGPKVEKQYGPSKEFERDNIDKQVLKTGKTIKKINESLLGHNSYRITIPYKAEKTSTIDCRQCHDVQLGDTLGAISIVMNMDDLKQISAKVIGYTALISFLLVVIILIYIRKLIVPYLSIFKEIQRVMNKANDGNYTVRIQGDYNGESKDVSTWINNHMDKVQHSLDSIEDKIDIFLTAHRINATKDPFIDVENTVERLADIYNFKKTIEHDENIMEVYKRFAVVLEDKFKIANFNFIEADTTNKKTSIVYVSKELICDPISDGCRSDRTNTLVDSCQFTHVCDKFTDDTKFYLCMPYSISNDLDFVLSIILDTKEEYDRVRDLLPLIEDYVNTAKPEIVSKKLMQILEKSAFTDPLTTLFNRKYLETYIDTTLYAGAYKNKPCGLMMVDIDFFKLINDNYGHDVGDIAIKTISNTLLDVVSDKGIVVRFGGEEFIVVLPDSNDEEILNTAEEVRIAFSQQKIQAGKETFSKTVSIGVSLFPNKQQDFWKYIKQTDIALYEAKQTGRNKVVRYTENMV